MALVLVCGISGDIALAVLYIGLDFVEQAAVAQVAVLTCQVDVTPVGRHTGGV